MAARLTIRPKQASPLGVRLALAFFSCALPAAACGLAWLAYSHAQEGAACLAFGCAALGFSLFLFACHLWPSLLWIFAGRMVLEFAEGRLLVRKSVFGLGGQEDIIPLTAESRLCLSCNEQMPLTFHPRLSLSQLLADEDSLPNATTTTYSVSLCSPMQEYKLQDFHGQRQARELLQELHHACPGLAVEIAGNAGAEHS